MLSKEVVALNVGRGLTLSQIAKNLNLSISGVYFYLRKYGLRTSLSEQRSLKYSEANLSKLVCSSTTLSDVLRGLGLEIQPGNFDTLRKYIKRYKLDCSHFVGKSAGRGGSSRKNLDEILVKDSEYDFGQLKRRLISEGLLPNECSNCKSTTQWQGKPLKMVLDHINGIKTDARIDNLRLLCPNCNSQTETFCRKNKYAGMV